MNYFTYILKSKTTGKYYVGSTGNLDKRLQRHNSGHVKSTKGNRPYVIVHCEECASKKDAYRREMQIKRYKGGKAFKSLIEST